jgi:hypothetical protein
MPLFIPAETIVAVRNMNNVCQANRFRGEEIIFPNCSAELITPVDVAAINI